MDALSAAVGAANLHIPTSYHGGKTKLKTSFEQEGLNQIYLISKPIEHEEGGDAVREVLMRSGNWLYTGRSNVGCEEITLK
jgi:hypothetical protein